MSVSKASQGGKVDVVGVQMGEQNRVQFIHFAHRNSRGRPDQRADPVPQQRIGE